MTLTLCGFTGSNYYNKVKLQLLEKGVAFEEELVWTGLRDNPALSTRSPLGKVPFFQTEQGVILESSVCSEYIESVYPQHPLIPKDPFAAAKVRELVVYLELHMELVARELFGPAYFGAPPAAPEKVEQVRKTLKKASPALRNWLNLAHISLAILSHWPIAPRSCISPPLQAWANWCCKKMCLLICRFATTSKLCASAQPWPKWLPKPSLATSS